MSKRSAFSNLTNEDKQERKIAFENYRNELKSSEDTKHKLNMFKFILVKYHKYLINEANIDNRTALASIVTVIDATHRNNKYMFTDIAIAQLKDQLRQELTNVLLPTVRQQIFKEFTMTLEQEIEDHSGVDDTDYPPDNAGEYIVGEYTKEQAYMISEGFYNMILDAIPSKLKNTFFNAL